MYCGVKRKIDVEKGGTHMLLGTHAPKLDDKGRVILPAKFREELQGGLVITRGDRKSVV